MNFDSSGNFSFTTTLPLDGSADSAHSIALVAADKAGNVSPTSTVGFVLDTKAPAIKITSPASSLLTNTNVTIVGTAIDAGTGLAGLTESLDSGAAVPVNVDGSGNFSFATTLHLDGTADGMHSIVLAGVDKVGNTASVGYSFTLKTNLPTAPAFSLDPLFRSAGNPYQTSQTPVTLDGTTDPGDAVVLVGTSFSTTADASGNFSFSGVPLRSGANFLTARATDLAGNQNSAAETITLLTNSPITAALLDDTAPGGLTNNDGITSDPTVVGTANLSINSLTAGFDATPASSYVNVLGDVSGNTFLFNRAEINRIYSGLNASQVSSLPDGRTRCTSRTRPSSWSPARSTCRSRSTIRRPRSPSPAPPPTRSPTPT